MKFMNIGILLLCIALMSSCKEEATEKTVEINTIKDAFAGKMTFGTAMNLPQIKISNEKEDSLIKRHFNSIVAENSMKMQNIHPEKDRYYWDDADAFVQYGEDNDMEIIGHTLAWHSQAAPWFFVDEDGNDVSRDELLARLKDHITTIMTRYKGRIHGYDVVNEAVTDGGEIRQSKYATIIGDDWIHYAFQYAQEADPDAELYYNDYNMANPAKRDKVIEVVTAMQAKGIKVDGIGMQGHMGLDSPTVEEYEASIEAFSKLGDVMITELDITVIPWPGTNVSAEISTTAEYQAKYNPYPTGLPDSVSMQLTNRYVDLFTLFNKHSDKIDRVTMWGAHDAQTWRNNWPIRGRSDYPLLFNRDFSPKPAVEKIIEIGKTKSEE